jgi:hypothetical protein
MKKLINTFTAITLIGACGNKKLTPEEKQAMAFKLDTILMKANVFSKGTYGIDYLNQDAKKFVLEISGE